MVVASYGLVWRNFWAFVGLSAIISLLSVVASIVPFGGLIGTPIGLAAIVVTPIGLAAIVVAGLLAFSRGAMPVFGSIGAAFKRFLPVVVTSSLYGLAVIALLFTIVGIPFAIYLAVRWSFVTQAVMVEKMGIGGAFSRSTMLVRDQWWRLLGCQLLMALATTVLFSPIFGVWMAFRVLARPTELLFTVALVPPMLVFAYVWEVFITLLYVDSRVRKEGYSRNQLNADLAGYG